MAKVEIVLQDQIIDFLTKNKIWHFRYTASTTYGMPDILALYKGYFIGIEVKREDGKGKSTILQKEIVKSIKRHGGLASIVDTINPVIELIRDIDTQTLKLNPMWTSLAYDYST